MKIKVTKDLCEIKENEIWNVGDYNVHTVQVELSPEFNGLVNKVRYFVEDKSYDMLITDNVAQVPYEATVMEGTIKIGVYGYDADTDILVQSTSPVNKYITSGTYTGDPDNTQPLTPTDKEQMETAIQKNTNDITDLKENKQDKLISGVNIKTINNKSILSSGNLTLVEEEADPIFTNSPAYSITDEDITYWNNKANMSDIPDVSNFITKDVDNLTYYTKSTDMQTAINNAVDSERTARENADNSLQNQIDAITVSSDVVDVVSTYQDLVDYDTQHIKANDIIKVMQDSTHDNAISYYRWVIVNHAGSWEYVGSEGPYYTKSETDILLNAKQNTITTTNKLQSDLVDDTNQTNLFVTSTEKTTWNNKLDQSDLTDYVKNTDYATSSKGGVIKTGYSSNVDANGNLYATNLSYTNYQNVEVNHFISKGTLENVITGKNLETANNKVTSISSSSTDVQYPSAKCVYDNDVIIKDDVNTKYDYLFSLTNLFGKITGTGTNITLNDTSDTIMKLNLDTTTSSQDTTTGKNLLPYKNTSKTMSGVTITHNANGSITLNGTSTENITYKLWSGNKTGILEENKSYVLSSQVDMPNKTFIRLQDSSSSSIFVDLSSQATVKNKISVKSSSFPTLSVSCFLFIYVGYTFNNYTIYPMLEEGTTATDYEPYTGGNPAPNPSYPQEIHVIKGNNEIKISNKNLWDYDNISNITNASISEKIITSNKIETTSYFNLSVFNSISFDSGTYVISADIKVVAGNPTLSKINDGVSDGTYILNPPLTNEYQRYATVKTYYSPFTMARILFQFVGKDSILEIKNIMVEKSSTATEYTPYQSQTYPINLGDIELCKIGDYKDILFKNTINSEYYNSSLELNKWYLRKSIEKKLFKGGNDEEWRLLSNTNKFYINLNRALIILNKMYSNYYLYNSTGQANLNNGEFTNIGGAGTYLWFRNDDISSANDFKTWLTTHNTSVYLPLATPTYTLLNDTLQTQLDSIQYALAYDTQTNISQTNNDLPFIINAETYQDISGKLDTSKVKNANSTTAGDVYDVRYINNMIGDVETILNRLTTGSGV